MKVVDKLIQIGLKPKNAKSILKGFEGSRKCLNDWNEFKNNFFGKDLIIKAHMSFCNTYAAWFDKESFSQDEIKIIKKLKKHVK